MVVGTTEYGCCKYLRGLSSSNSPSIQRTLPTASPLRRVVTTCSLLIGGTDALKSTAVAIQHSYPTPQKSIQQIRSIATTQDGEIEGWLAPETAGVDLSGIHVVIRSGSQVYRALTDEDGYFQFRAPKGSYVVDFSNNEYYLNGGDEFWYGPVRFKLHAGESAALQMVSVRHPKK